MLKTNNKRNEGFTIIEVLIVLAIAGLILLIVFLAVPALQRNQRNTARKNDAGRIGSAISDFVSNTGGKLPASSTDLDTVMTDAGNLSQFTKSSLTTASGALAASTPNVFSVDATTTVPTMPAETGNDLLLVEQSGTGSGFQCSGNTITQTGASSRNAVLMYTVEPGGTGNWTWDCLDISG